MPETQFTNSQPRQYGHWRNDPINRKFKKDSKSSRITNPGKAGSGFAGGGKKEASKKKK